MKTNNSPWLTQLHHEREIKILDTDMTTDVVIIGGGIAGVTTLFFLLKYTDKKVVLIEAKRLAHGATGHNAGQIVAEFEKPLIDIVREYGMGMAVRGLGAVESAWDLLDEIFETTNLDVPWRQFIGYGGYAELEQLLGDLETELIKHDQGLMTFPILVSYESKWFAQIPERYRKICIEVDQVVITESLSITSDQYHAALPQKKGVMNSALFTEKLALWCLENYQDRCQIFEESFVHGIELDTEKPLVITNDAKVICDSIVLCTNGFENFYIHNKDGLEIDTKFHHALHGAVGYMTGFVSNRDLEPMANYYYEQGKKRSSDPFTSDPYFYVTRRDFEHSEGFKKLVTVGGPEVRLENREIYYREFDVAEEFHNDSVRFSGENFNMEGVEEKFFWHGLMGYTTTGLRLVGYEPLDPRLLYNLGCNGVGILPGIMGARKIASHINNEKVEVTIFDPKR